MGSSRSSSLSAGGTSRHIIGEEPLAAKSAASGLVGGAACLCVTKIVTEDTVPPSGIRD